MAGHSTDWQHRFVLRNNRKLVINLRLFILLILIKLAFGCRSTMTRNSRLLSPNTRRFSRSREHFRALLGANAVCLSSCGCLLMYGVGAIEIYLRRFPNGRYLTGIGLYK